MALMLWQELHFRYQELSLEALAGSWACFHQDFVHWMSAGLSRCGWFPVGRSGTSSHPCLLQSPGLGFPFFCCRPSGCPSAPDPGFPCCFSCAHTCSVCFPSRWASRSSTTQRRKDRLRQHSEHIGLDNDMREVGGLIWGQHKLWSRRWRFGQQCAYYLGQFCVVWLGLCSHLDAAPLVVDAVQLQSTQHK